MTLKDGLAGQSYYIGSVEASDKNKNYLLTLGVFAGSTVTIITRTKYTYILSVKDARYAIDQQLAEKIMLIPSDKYSSQAVDTSQAKKSPPPVETLQPEVEQELQEKKLEARKKTQEAHAQTQEARKQTELARAKTQEARKKTELARAKAQLAREQADTPSEKEEVSL